MVVVVVLAGPSLIACSESSDGFAACLRLRVVDAGLLPPAASGAVVVAPQAEPEPPTPAAPEPQSIVAAVPPELTLLRAEPDGSLLIAGTGSPGARIEVYANGAPLGTTTAEPSGDWVVVPEAPLAAGGVEISVGEAGGETLAEQSFVVVIDPERSAEPLVVATRPGEASAVLQGLPLLPEAPEKVAIDPDPEPRTPAATPAPVTEPASAEAPGTAVATVEPDAIEPEPAPAPVVIIPPSIDAIEIDGTANFFAGGGAEGATMRLYVDDNYVADAIVAEGRWLVEAQSALTQPSQRVRIDMLKPGTAEVAARAEVNFVVDLLAAEPKPLPPVEVAEPEPAPAAQPEPTIVAEPSDRELAPALDAATTSAPGRDLAATSDAAPAAGIERDLTVAAKAGPTPPVDRDLGAAQKPSAEVAIVPVLTQPAKEAGHTGDKAIEAANVPDAEVSTPKPLTPSIKPVIVPEPEPGPVASPTPKMPVSEPAPQVAGIEIPPAQEPAATTVTPAKQAVPAKPAMPAATAAPAQPASPEVPAPTTTIAAVPAEEKPVPTLKAVPVGDPEAMRFASGKAIIRRGDNLWSIARRIYGDGLKYTTIYRANKDQIRSPGRIYPGQVFDLPLVYDE